MNTSEFDRETNLVVLKEYNNKNQLETFTSKSDIQKNTTSSAYTLFNKNFTTFMKYTDSNLDINMVVSNDSPGFAKQQQIKKESESDDSKILVKELAATSLNKNKNSIVQIKDKARLSKSFDSMPLKRQNNCLNYKFNQQQPVSTTTTPKQEASSAITTTTPIKDKCKLFCSNSSSASSTSSNHSSSSTSSSRNHSNETPKFPVTSRVQQPDSTTTTDKLEDSNFLTGKKVSANSLADSSAQLSNTMLKASVVVNINTPFNIENELIKYTKNLKLHNRLYSDRYKLGNHIRNGGFSEIYEGNIINNSDKNVIIKLIPKRKTKNWLMVHSKKYPAEVLLHKMCNKIEGVVEMLEFFEQDNDWIIIMPKVENCLDLFDYLESKQRGRLDESEACHFFTQLVHINIDLLNHGIVHRDIKSENILVDLDTMKLILIDFGASAICRNRSSQGSGNQQHQYTDFHGTRQYKPPEYISSKKYTALASTVWTLGILLFDMCNGQLPFETEQEITEYNLQMKAPVSDEYKILLNDCLCVDPLKRPSLDEVLEYPWCVNNLKVDFVKDLD